MGKKKRSPLPGTYIIVGTPLGEDKYSTAHHKVDRTESGGLRVRRNTGEQEQFIPPAWFRRSDFPKPLPTRDKYEDVRTYSPSGWWWMETGVNLDASGE